MAPPAQPPPSPGAETTPWPSGWRAFWQLLNRPRPFRHQTIRVACTVLLLAHGAIAWLRNDLHHPEFLWIRVGIALYALLGACLANRLDWPALRAYTTGLAFLLPLGTAYIDGVLGNSLADLALTALATFVPLMFLQTGRDVALVSVLLLAGNVALLAHLPPPAVPPTTVAVIVGAATVTGMVAGLTIVVYRAGMVESTTWWREACTRLQHALNTKSEFLNTMSHELRSPLHVIVGYADMLHEDPGADARQAAGRIRASALELLQLVENTMNVTRLDARKVALRIEEFALPEVLEELAESVAALPEGKRGVPVHWEVAPHLAPVLLDRLKFKEIVQNLVTNALKFTPEGSVRVQIDQGGDWLHVAVHDTGVGIPPEAQARIFEIFERLEQSGGQAPAGAGLGLYIVRTLVDLMHGRIEVASEPGAGSCFTLRLPLRLETTAA